MPSLGETSQRSILSLDKSDAPFSTLIDEACEFLDIQLEENGLTLLYEKDDSRRSQGSDPRIDWTLRWLLKNLQTTEVRPGSVCLDYRAWMLLRELVLRTPLTSVARLLSAHKLTGTIQSTLQWLAEKCRSIPEDLFWLIEADMSDPNSALEEASPGSLSQPSRKRKRDGQSKATTTWTPKDVRFLYTSICCNLIEMQDIITDGSQGYAVEHLKAALRCPLEIAASTLDCAAIIAGFLVRYRCDRSKMEYDGAWVLPMVQFWQSQLPGLREDLNLSVNLVFSKHCFQSVLHLLLSYHKNPKPEDEIRPVSAGLIDLLRNHILSPARSSGLNALRPRDVRDPDIPTGLLETLLTPLMDNLEVDEVVSLDSLESVAFLFEIAAEHSMRIVPKDRRNETAWLQKLLNHIMQRAHAFDYYDLDDERQLITVDFSVKMLDSCLQSKVNLDTGTLERIIRPLFHHQRIFTEREWNLVSLCIQLDATVFVKPSGNVQVYKECLQQVPSDLLSLLLNQISRDGQKLVSANTNALLQPETRLPYDMIRYTVVVPVANAFIQTRQFSRFLDIWQGQLEQHYLSNNHETVSIWRDDQLLHAVAHLVESALSISEIEKRLHVVVGELESALVSPANLGKLISLAVTLECLLSGSISNRTLQQLGEPVLVLYKLLLQLTTDSTEDSNEFQDSCWRIMTIINDRWSLPHQSLDSEVNAVRTAKNLIENVIDDACDPQRPSPKYSAGFYAFRFMLSLTDVETAIPDAYWSAMGAATEHILDHSSACLRPGTFHLLKWSGQDDLITRGSLFGIACCAQLTTIPRTLSLMNKVVQFLVLHYIWSLAWSGLKEESIASSEGLIEHSKWTTFNESSQVSALQLWQRLSRSMMLDEYSQLSACCRDFQVSKYLQNSSFDNADNRMPEDDRHDDQVLSHDTCLTLLMTTPLHLFTKTQKINLSNRLLQVLVNKSIGINSIARALNLLVFFTKTPSSSMLLLKKPDMTLDDNPSNSQGISPTWLFEIAACLDEIGSAASPDVQALIQLKHLTDLVLQYLCFGATGSSRAGYLRTIYQQVDQKLKLRAEIGSVTHLSMISVIQGIVNFYILNHDHVTQLIPEFSQSLDGWRRKLIEVSNKFERIALDSANVNSVTGISYDITDAQRAAATPPTEGQPLPAGDGPTSLFTVDHYSEGILRMQKFRRKHLLSEEDGPLIDEAFATLDGLETPEEEKYLLNTFQGVAQRRDQDALLRAFCQKLLRDTSDQGDSLERFTHEFSVLRLLERVLIGLKGLHQSSDTLGSSLSQVLTKLCDMLHRSLDCHAAVQAMRCISIILRYQGKVISQFHIDSLMSAIAVKSSAMNRQIHEFGGGGVYLGLCRLFETSIVLQRSKLGGRYHLILQALQCLLRCLFIPYENVEHGQNTAEEIMAYAGYGETQATAYARLLTKLCDPTVSAVSRSRQSSRQELNDETQKARSIAGQHLQYVIEDFCICQLQGRLLPGMKVALSPGLWAIFEVMSQGVMRNLNASMGSASRSVFKALYDEYRRSGQWKKSSSGG